MVPQLDPNISAALFDIDCGTSHRGWSFLLSSILTPMLLALIIGSVTFVKWLQKKLWRRKRYFLARFRGESYPDSDEISWATILQQKCAHFISAQLPPGKTLAIAEFCAGITCLLIYLHSVAGRVSDVETCSMTPFPVIWLVDFVCNLFLMMTFGLRLCAATHKLWYLLEKESVVNYCTIPPAFVSLLLRRQWIGLRCMRACHLLSIPDILQSFHVLTARSTVRFTQILCLMTTVLLTSSGIFHLLENTGDFWLGHPRIHNLSYFESVYFSFVTISTVGYGDINPETTLGRLFCCIFVMASLAIFASAIPEIYVLFCGRRRYGGSYKMESGIGHVVVTGHIDATFMVRFLKDFNRDDRKRNDVKIVFVGRVPDVDMESVLRCNDSAVVYLEGSLLNVADLRRAQSHLAMACFIVTNKGTPHPALEDSTAVMLATSIKNFHTSTRCIVQLQQSRAKGLLMNIPGFTTKRGDAALCFQELEYGLIAQSCVAPGASTLLSNLMQSPSKYTTIPTGNAVARDFFNGCLMEIHLGGFGPYFIGMKFCDAAELCFLRLDLLLIGLFRPESDNQKQGLLLCPLLLALTEDRIGIFVAKSADDVSRAQYFCGNCHGNELEGKNVIPCKCSYDLKICHRSFRNPFEHLLHITGSSNFSAIGHRQLAKPPAGFEAKILSHIRLNPRTPLPAFRESRSTDDIIEEQHQFTKRNHHQLDITKSFHWCTGEAFYSVLLTRSLAAHRPFRGHVVVLILAKSGDAPIGLRELVMPLRSSKIPFVDLKEIILLGEASFLEREWQQIYNFPKITLVKGDPLSRADLRAVSVNTCASCVVLSASMGTSANKALDDKSAILATLNIKAMSSEDGDRIAFGSMCDTEIPVITEIQHDSNVRLLDHYAWTNEDEDPDVFLSEPYMCGKAVTLSSLDSMLVTTYFNPLAIVIMRYLLWGFQSPTMESLLAEGIGLVAGDHSADNQTHPTANTAIKLIDLAGGLYGHTNEITDYGNLFRTAIKSGFICLGLSRRIYSSSDDPYKAFKRCVITNPPNNYRLRSDDRVFILSQ